jgi:Predicted membrane protein
MSTTTPSPAPETATTWWHSPATWGAVIVILHVVGAVGTALGYAHLLLPLTPLNLIVCAGIVMAFTGAESPWRWALTMFLGFGIEVMGVATGWLFGAYSYGEGLGPKALEVPLLMGVLWWLLLLGTHHWAERFLAMRNKSVSVWTRSALAASLMTALDGTIEPVAIRAGWWAWNDGTIPWTNYLTWWLASFALGMLWRDVDDLKTNRLSGLLVVVFALFFVLLNLIPWTL